MTTLGRSRALARAVLTTLTLALVLTMPGLAAAHAAPDRASGPAAEPLVIGHRGASGYRPEHTLASYRLAIRQGADYIEPDLVPTKDGVLVARHENEIGGTTDVADRPEFASRRQTKTIDGRQVTGWFTEDFTLAELKTLRAVERLPDVRPNNTRYDGRFEVPTFDQVLDLVNKTNRKRKGTRHDIGVYPETKHPTYFQSIGLALERPLLRDLREAGLDRKNAKVYLQSFETTNLQWLAKRTKLPIIQLMDAAGAPYDLVDRGDPRTYADLTKPRELRKISRYADGIGPNKTLVLPVGADGFLTSPSALVRDAHRAGLDVHVFTLRRENQFMARDFWQGTDPNAPGNMRAEVRAFLDTGIDGFFTDNPDIGVGARDAWQRTTGKRAA
ncbi:glycerophosphodiester phosphodiesterase [Nocardioides aequoreus]|uniref:glycerophosphodiester phosphodiesterase n=1 Tax=Nocardioides aequoreus TaxID=397278 RepID=UPI00068BF55B|nr:glycerophosphodiester phosphodiesterase [Nocardioides aequoreus]